MSEPEVTIESLLRIKEALEPQPRGDKPRLIVVCHPDEYPEIQRVIVRDLGNRDVLVKPNRYVDRGQAIVIDGERALGPLASLNPPEGQ